MIDLIDWSDCVCGHVAIERLTDVDGLHVALETGLSNAPEPRDSER